MTKKDYKLIAEVIYVTIEKGGGIPELIEELCVNLEVENPKFDGEKFKKACYKEA